MNSELCFHNHDLSYVENSINEHASENVVIFVDGTSRNVEKGQCLTTTELENLPRTYVSNIKVVKIPYSGQLLDPSIISAFEAGWNTILITGKRDIRVGGTIFRDYVLYSGKPIHRNTFLNGSIEDMRAEELVGVPQGNDRSDYGQVREEESEYVLTDADEKVRDALRERNRIANAESLARQEAVAIANENWAIEMYLSNLNDDIFELNISGRELRTLPDLSRFTELKRLSCANNYLTTIANLPDSISDLNCSNNNLTVIGSYPRSLEMLNCSFNRLTAFSNLPDGLKMLNCSYNQFQTITGLPNSLERLDCENNHLQSLQESLPFSLKGLFCYNNELETLPELRNSSLIDLNCSNNKLTELPALPDTLEMLICHNNLLTIMPELPASLRRLDCFNNRLEFIPNRGAIRSFNCSNQMRI